MLSTSETLTAAYENCKDERLFHRRFKHDDLVEIIKSSSLDFQVVGHSFEKRDIYKCTVGTGPIQVLLWSQMHGNEATATMAMADLFRFFESESPLVDVIKEHLTLHFVPMLNPDGAERFIRRTAQMIDMNRDALDFHCPESKLLKRLQDEIKPLFSFNLHDQSVRYAAGEGPHQTAIAFLATAYNEAREWNENRSRAMQLICCLQELMQEFIPGRIARFSDEFEPRAFGDNIQAWGSSLILIESGGNGDDTEKQELRKYNFMMLLRSFELIATAAYTHQTLEQYEAIPLNTKCLFDVLIRRAEIDGQPVDIGINLEEHNILKARDFETVSIVEDLGDLSTYWGIKEIDATGMQVEPLENFLEILTGLDITLPSISRLLIEKNANFALAENGQCRYLILDGKPMMI